MLRIRRYRAADRSCGQALNYPYGALVESYHAEY